MYTYKRFRTPKSAVIIILIAVALVAWGILGLTGTPLAKKGKEIATFKLKYVDSALAFAKGTEEVTMEISPGTKWISAFPSGPSNPIRALYMPFLIPDFTDDEEWDDFDDDIDQVLGRCREAGVGRIYLPNIDHTSIERMLILESKIPELFESMIGLHPCSVKDDFKKELYIIEDWLSKRRFAGIGETGIDLYWDKTFYKEQVDALEIQIEWAKRYKMPIILHCRESLRETIDLVGRHSNDDLIGIFHCFTGTVEQAKEIIALGFKLGIGGVLTYKNSNLNEVLYNIGTDHILLESDSPYLAPVPKRGKRNEPAFIRYVVLKIAEILDIEVSQVEEITSKNALMLFENGNQV